MTKWAYICLVAGLTISVTACTTASIREGETVVTSAELRSLLVGNTVYYSGPPAATTRFGADGRYETRAGSWVDRGRYSLDNDQECTFPDTRAERCGQYLRTSSGDLVFLRTKGPDVGTRMPITSIR